MKRTLLILPFLLTFTSISAQQEHPVEDYVIDRFKDSNGREVVKIIVPGRPPEHFRMPVVYPARSSSTLGNVPAYEWSFGCSPTAAAMNAGYYDRTSFPNVYTGPTNGGIAPLDNSVWGSVTINGEIRQQCPISATRQGLDGRSIRGHVDDYWIQSGSSSTDPYITNGWTEHTYGDCVGDYMKTNQSVYDNNDGTTAYYYYSDGSPYSGNNNNKDGMYGLKLFFESRGYTVVTHFNQYIYGHNGNTLGFTFAQYKQEIDAGRPVLIQVSGHTMLGFGYDDAGTNVYLHDTWDYETHIMTWGGSYAGLQHYGVGVIQLEDNPYCTSCPNYDFTVTPTIEWTTHSSSHEANGCKLYRVSVTSGNQYTFKTGCGNGATTNYNTFLELYNASCGQILSNNDGCESTLSKIVWTANYTGYAYLKVTGYQNNAGNYTLAYSYCNVPSQPGPITGNTPVCQGSTQSYLVAATDGVTYTWQVPAGWTITSGQGTGAVMVTAGSSNGNIQVTPSNTCGNGTVRTLAVTAITVPAQPSAITGPTNPCLGSSSVFSVTNVSGVTYAWQVPADWSITAGQGTHSITVSVGQLGGNIQVTPSNACGEGPLRSLAVNVVTVPEQPSAIEGSQSPCQGSLQTYTVTTLPGVSYLWQVPDGWTINSGQGTSVLSSTVGAGSGNVQVTPSNDCGEGVPGTLGVNVNLVPAQPSAITGDVNPCTGTSQNYAVTSLADVSYLWSVPGDWVVAEGQGTASITATVGVETGNIQVVPSNMCGDGIPSSLGVTVNAIPASPSAIQGEINPCLGSLQSYSVTPVAGFAYTWSVPDDWTILSGQGTHAIETTVAGNSGALGVIPSNVCGNGPAATLDIQVNTVPEQPSAITGPAIPCQGSTQVYSVNGLANVGYTWNVPSGWTIMDGQGTSSIMTIVGEEAGNIAVTPSNTCGDGSPAVFTLSMTADVPEQPSVIQGDENPCYGTAQTYTISPVDDVLYTWNVPLDWTITEGQGTHSLNVVVGSMGGVLEVIPSNFCGDGLSRSQYMQVSTVPALLSAISGEPVVCQFQNDVTYTITPVADAIDYLWIYSGSGADITNQGPSILIDFDGTATSGDLIVIVSNVCGMGAISEAFTISVVPPVEAPLFLVGPSSIRCQGEESVIYTAIAENSTGIWYSLDINSLAAGNTIDAGTGNVFFTAEWSGVSVITASADGCYGPVSSSHTVTINPLPLVSFSYVGSPFCFNEPNPLPILDEGAVGGTFSSTPGLVFVDSGTGEIDLTTSTPGTYYITNTVEASDECPVVTATEIITIYSLPSVYAGADRSIPYGSSVTISDANAYGYLPMIVSWSPPGAFEDASQLNATTVSLFQPVTCTLTVTDYHGCHNTSEMAIAISDGSFGVNPIASPSGVCLGGTSQLSANAEGGSGSYSYSWTSEPAGFSSTIADPVVNPDVTTTYTVVAGDGIETKQETVTVVVYPLPEVDCPADMQVYENDPAFALTGGIPAGGTYDGTGVVAGMFDPFIAGTGDHTIIYTFIDIVGCDNSCSFTITVIENPNPPSDLIVLDVTSTTATVDWTPGGSETQWDIAYGTFGFNPQSGGTLLSGIGTRPFLLENLDPLTPYDFYVRSEYGDVSSEWAGPVSFVTTEPSDPGDANGDTAVNVLDIITITNYILALNPDPFNFDNADTNDDQLINVLDIIGTVNIIMAP